MKWLAIILTLALALGCEQSRFPERPEPRQAQALDYTELLAALESLEQECSAPQCYAKKGSADVPIGLRIDNYAGGSCYHAATGTMLGTVNRQHHGIAWTQTFRGGETAAGIRRKLDAWGIDYAATCSGDRRILDWCHRTSRVAVIDFHDNHICNFVRWQQGGDGRWWAVVLDNNHAERYDFYTEQEFLSEWRRQGGCATAAIDPANAPTLF